MRIIGHGIDVESIAGIKEQVDSPNKKWAEQFCSDDERRKPTIRLCITAITRAVSPARKR